MSSLPPRRTRRTTRLARDILFAAGLTLLALLVYIVFDEFDPYRDTRRLVNTFVSALLLFRYYSTRGKPGANDFGYYLVLAGFLSAGITAAGIGVENIFRPY